MWKNIQSFRNAHIKEWFVMSIVATTPLSLAAVNFYLPLCETYEKEKNQALTRLNQCIEKVDESTSTSENLFCEKELKAALKAVQEFKACQNKIRSGRHTPEKERE
ncbi:MAG: hypothetical protein JWQ35_242 [Bacteriovoracaceae bacterium]|nr:hypothetical protein [Bacteriovoracaceae bacterium]